MLHVVSTGVQCSVDSRPSCDNNNVSSDVTKKDAVIDVEDQVEMTEFSVSLKKRLSRTLTPLVHLTFHGDENSSDPTVELRDKDNNLVFTILPASDREPDRAQIAARRASTDANNNDVDGNSASSSSSIPARLVSFVDETASTMFTAIFTDKIIRVMCGTEDLGTVEQQPIAKGMTGKDSDGKIIFQAYVEENLFKKSTEPAEILVFAGEEPIAKLCRKDESTQLCLSFLEQLSFSNKAVLLSAAYSMRSIYYSQRVAILQPKENCCLLKIVAKAVLASTAALMVLATVSIVILQT